LKIWGRFWAILGDSCKYRGKRPGARDNEEKQMGFTSKKMQKKGPFFMLLG
jgi:hypothetical protein